MPLYPVADYSYLVVARVIADIRLKKRINQVALSEQAGLNRTHLGMIENGRKSCSMVTLWKIAEALDTPLSEILRIAEKTINDIPEEERDEYFQNLIDENNARVRPRKQSEPVEPNELKE